MSRSKQKLPIFGNANGSEKQDKRLANRAVRVKVRTLLANGEEVVDLDTRDVSNVYSFKKDGKRYVQNAEEKWLRK